MSTIPAPEPPIDDPVDPLPRFTRRTGVSPDGARRLLPEEREVLDEAVEKLTPEAMGVLVAVAETDRGGLLARLAALSERDRHSCVPYLKRFLRPLRASDWPERPGTRGERVHDRRLKLALLLAGAVCEREAAAAARWVRHTKLQRADTSYPDALWLLGVLADRPEEWRADFADRIAERRNPGLERFWFPLAREMMVESGRPVPTHGDFVRAWMRGIEYPPRYCAEGISSRDYPDTLLDRLREDPLLDALLPWIFQDDDSVALLWTYEAEDADRWPWALAALAGEGRVDRAPLLDAVLACLVRGGRPSRAGYCLEVLAHLDPTDEECAERVPTLLRLLPGSHSTVAGFAQQRLRALDDAGLLGTEHLVEASRSALLRTEKKLVRAQLTWLDRAARRDPSRAGAVVLAAADVFGHEDTAIRERAWAVVARHLPHAPDGVRTGLAAASAALGPAPRARAAEILGAEPSDDTAPATG
ncbi:hypothetical protein NI17_018495 [Thermobifida halotolerans]|uniref:DUF6493 domain-containing protein n=1 Tax=Thermobifida halotolerans TaxID=483545 RepID=A0A399FY98_9ACTN|nr:DUF6493 family protein [Thermobifida halotolerans]UOE18754.1 hypothetical protein NI17_018495 [Thermobifida halotolerans]